MGRMSDLQITIQEMLVDGMDAKTIANRLHVPLNWVIACEDALFHDPYQYADEYADADAIAYGEM
jgi:hypothetical protein